ncbi:MAG: DsbA family protein [Patescibacteria group bacterium]
MKKITAKNQTPVTKSVPAPVASQPMMDPMQQIVAMQKMMQKMFLIVIVLVVAVGGLLVKDLVLNKNAAPAANTAPTAGEPTDPFALITKYPTIQKDDYVQGDKNSKYQMITYSDLQCPFCHRFHPTTLQFLENHKDVAFAYRHYPLTQIHPQAVPAAIASECVAKLGGTDAFFKFIDKVNTAPEDAEGGLDVTKLAGYAVESGVDEFAFTACNDAQDQSRVDAQQKTGNEFGVSGTPSSFLVNVKDKKAVMIPGAYPIEQVEQAFEKIK